MDNVPTDPRVTAMLAALFGKDWQEKLDGDVTFNSGPMDSWIVAVETMLRAADAVDPIRIAIRGLVQEGGSPDRPGSSLPSRADV